MTNYTVEITDDTHYIGWGLPRTSYSLLSDDKSYTSEMNSWGTNCWRKFHTLGVF